MNEQLKSFLLFEATLISTTVIKDFKQKYNVKRYFELWFNCGRRYWKELMKELKNKPEGENAYDELSAILYETSSKLIESDKTDELLSELKTLLKKY